jgi:hypothetical protein
MLARRGRGEGGCNDSKNTRASLFFFFNNPWLKDLDFDMLVVCLLLLPAKLAKIGVFLFPDCFCHIGLKTSYVQ